MIIHFIFTDYARIFCSSCNVKSSKEQPHLTKESRNTCRSNSFSTVYTNYVPLTTNHGNNTLLLHRNLLQIGAVWRQYRLENTEGVIKMDNPENWQHSVHKTRKIKHKHYTICVWHNYSQANTNNVNNARACYKLLEVETNRTSFLRGIRNGHRNTKTIHCIAPYMYLPICLSSPIMVTRAAPTNGNERQLVNDTYLNVYIIVLVFRSETSWG